ncbi:hypothetical protein [Geodermatophilus sp. SYSU D00779]
MVDLDSWDLGDVLAIVERPDAFLEEDRSSSAAYLVKTTVKATVSATMSSKMSPTMSAAAGALVVVPLVLLMVKGRRTEAPPPHAALMSVEDARRLVQRDLLFFPEGGPSVGHVYARHPLRRRDYVSYAGFHRFLLNEKSVEAARYLLSLGARDIEITWRESIGKSAKAEGGIGLPDAEDVSLTMGFGRDDTGKLAIRITGAGKARPVLDDLIWPDRDPMFKLMRTSADAGAEEFHVGIKTERSASVNASAAVKLRDLGFSLGGEYKRYEDLAFTVDATFTTST